MKFNDMLKKKKKENTDTPENMNTTDQENIHEDGQEQAQTETAEQELVEAPSAEDKLKDELSQANDKYLRLYAEFDNFRRRTQKERADERANAGKEVIVSLLTVLDDFERATKAMENSTDVNAVKEGVA